MISAPQLEAFLQFFVIPLWILAGLGDWLCHRLARIENSTGARESALHWLQLAEIGVPVLAALFLEINALVLAVMLGAFGLHYATAMWDVAYAARRRRIAPAEQHVHGLLELVPLLALCCVLFLHWDQFLALLGAGTQPADFSVQRKSPALPPAYIAGTLVALVLLEMLPFAEEMARCLRPARGARPLFARAARP
jgi:hypothetical protein